MSPTSEMFPDVPIAPTLVATSWTVGGLCAHCRRAIKRGKGVFKLAPSCCATHKKEKRQGSKNGPGRWVCWLCKEQLVPKE